MITNLFIKKKKKRKEKKMITNFPLKGIYVWLNPFFRMKILSVIDWNFYSRDTWGYWEWQAFPTMIFVCNSWASMYTMISKKKDFHSSVPLLQEFDSMTSKFLTYQMSHQLWSFRNSMTFKKLHNRSLCSLRKHYSKKYLHLM